MYSYLSVTSVLLFKEMMDDDEQFPDLQLDVFRIAVHYALMTLWAKKTGRLEKVNDNKYCTTFYASEAAKNQIEMVMLYDNFRASQQLIKAAADCVKREQLRMSLGVNPIAWRKASLIERLGYLHRMLQAIREKRAQIKK